MGTSGIKRKLNDNKYITNCSTIQSVDGIFALLFGDVARTERDGRAKWDAVFRYNLVTSVCVSEKTHLGMRQHTFQAEYGHVPTKPPKHRPI